jgi:hypothetical protein
MSRAVLMIALHESLGRLPTPEEKERFLRSLAASVSSDRIYVAHRPLCVADAEPEIRRLRAEGLSVRRIAAAVGWGKSAVAALLSVQNSALKVDSEAA